MTTTWPAHWPADARDIARTVTTALDAAQDDDADAFADATADLAALPYGHAEAVHSAIIRGLLEVAHAGGLSGDDVHALVVDIVAAHAEWSLDRTALTIVVLGALGVDIDPAFFAGDNQDPEDVPEMPRLTAVESAQNSILVIESLVTKIDDDAAPYIRAAIDEIARAETVEMP